MKTTSQIIRNLILFIIALLLVLLGAYCCVGSHVLLVNYKQIVSNQYLDPHSLSNAALVNLILLCLLAVVASFVFCFSLWLILRCIIQWNILKKELKTKVESDKKDWNNKINKFFAIKKENAKNLEQ